MSVAVRAIRGAIQIDHDGRDEILAGTTELVREVLRRNDLADKNVIGQVAFLGRLMQSEAWQDFGNELGLTLHNFADVGLAPTATDVEVW